MQTVLGHMETNLSPLKVEIETVDSSVPFRDAQRELASTGRRFSNKTLKQIPYSQLHLCCIGSAGITACSPSLVYLEKERRLGRFVSLAPEELTQAERWLQAQGMLGDVVAAISSRVSPSWDNLKARQKAIIKLMCLCNHWNDPEERLLEAVELIREAAGDGIPPMMASSMCSGLVSLARRHLGIDVTEKARLTEVEFREGIWKVMEAILDLLPREEQTVLIREQFQGYSCTSDCFRSY